MGKTRESNAGEGGAGVKFAEPKGPGLPQQDIDSDEPANSPKDRINPRAAPHFEETQEIPHRCVFCIKYGICLDFAIEQGWDSFDCEDCRNYEPVVCSPAKWLEDSARCRALINVLENPGEFSRASLAALSDFLEADTMPSLERHNGKWIQGHE